MENFDKYTSKSAIPILRHVSRDNKTYSNKSIDLSLSHLNYDLSPPRDITPLQYYRQRLSEVYVYGREDTVTLASVCVSLPAAVKDLPVQQQRRFFEVTYDFLAERYGGESAKNVVAATVHYDEIIKRPSGKSRWSNEYLKDDKGNVQMQAVAQTPHIHFSFVPAVPDAKHAQGEKVCCAKVLSYREYKQFHADFQAYIDNHLDFSAVVKTGATGKGRTIEEVKLQHELDRIQDINIKHERSRWH